MHNALETRSALEQRWGGTMIGGAFGYDMIQPSAIPPPSMRNMSYAGVTVNLHTVHSVDAVWIALRVISTHLTKLGNLRPYKEQLTKDNEVYRAWQPPAKYPILQNTYSCGWQRVGMDQTVRSMALTGDLFWYIVDRDRLQYPAMIEVLHPGLMDVRLNSSGQQEYFYQTPGGRVELNPSNVIHMPFNSMPQSLRGLSPIEYAAPDLALQLASLEWATRFFSQGSSPGYALTTDAAPTEAEVRALMQNFQVKHGGITNSHLPLILTNGLKATQIQISPDDAQAIETQQAARAAIAAWFGIPLHMINSAAEKGNAYGPGATEQMLKYFIINTLAQYITAIEEAYSSLLPQGVFAGFDLNRLSAPDAASQAQLITALRNTQAYSVNDGRLAVGKPPVDDPAADEVLAPLASNTAPEQTNNDDPPQQTAPPER